MFSRLSLVALIAFCLSLVAAADAAEAGGEWVRVPSSWLLHRFVRSSEAAPESYRVAIAVTAAPNIKSAHPKIVRSSGTAEVDMVAVDFMRDSVQHNGALRDLLKTKELYFQFTLTPPALDVNMRNAAGRRPVPAGHELSTPTSPSVFFSERDFSPSHSGDLAVIFPAGGGYPLAALVTSTSGSEGVDRYYVHTAALNWQTTHKSGDKQIFRTTFGMRKPQRGESVGE